MVYAAGQRVVKGNPGRREKACKGKCMYMVLRVEGEGKMNLNNALPRPRRRRGRAMSVERPHSTLCFVGHLEDPATVQALAPS